MSNISVISVLIISISSFLFGVMAGVSLTHMYLFFKAWKKVEPNEINNNLLGDKND